MSTQERQFKFDAEKVKDYAYPNQEVRLVNGKSFITLDAEENQIEVSYNLGRFIFFALTVRKKRFEVEDYHDIKSELLKNFLSLSNCHRTMLVAMGFDFKDVLDSNFGVSLVEDYLSENRIAVNEMEKKVLEIKQEEFPLSINLFATQEDKKIEPIHSFIILGRDNKGRFVCFHKDGFGDADKVEITDIQDILKDYANKKITYATIYTQTEVDKILKHIKHKQ